jgi:hypothetical protein
VELVLPPAITAESAYGMALFSAKALSQNILHCTIRLHAMSLEVVPSGL